MQRSNIEKTSAPDPNHCRSKITNGFPKAAVPGTPNYRRSLGAGNGKSATGRIYRIAAVQQPTKADFTRTSTARLSG